MKSKKERERTSARTIGEKIVPTFQHNTYPTIKNKLRMKQYLSGNKPEQNTGKT